MDRRIYVVQERRVTDFKAQNCVRVRREAAMAEKRQKIETIPFSQELNLTVGFLFKAKFGLKYNRTIIPL